MHGLRTFVLALALAFMTLSFACEKVDQAFEAVDKAKAVKDDMQKKAEEIGGIVRSKADEVIGITKKDESDSSKGKDKEESRGDEREHEED